VQSLISKGLHTKVGHEEEDWGGIPVVVIFGDDISYHHRVKVEL
jgi:hypothetical protein